MLLYDVGNPVNDTVFHILIFWRPPFGSQAAAGNNFLAFVRPTVYNARASRP